MPVGKRLGQNGQQKMATGEWATEWPTDNGRREADNEMADWKWTTESTRREVVKRKWAKTKKPTQTNWEKIEASGRALNEGCLGAPKNVFKRFLDASVCSSKTYFFRCSEILKTFLNVFKQF